MRASVELRIRAQLGGDRLGSAGELLRIGLGCALVEAEQRLQGHLCFVLPVRLGDRIDLRAQRAENAVEDRALLVRHVDGDAAERRRAGRGIGDGNRAAGRRPCAVSGRERIGIGDDGALAGVDGCGGRGGNEGRAGRLVDEAAAEFIFNQAEDDGSGAGNDGIGDHHGVGADRFDGIGV